MLKSHGKYKYAYEFVEYVEPNLPGVIFNY